MPLLKPRPGQNDGGYAVMDYRAVRPELGSIDDLRSWPRYCARRGSRSLLILFSTMWRPEHQWAVNARAGDLFYRNYFHMFADRELPDAYEQNAAGGLSPISRPETSPMTRNLIPGSGRPSTPGNGISTGTTRMSSTSSPDLILWLANLGVECLRLDAIAFIYKRMGTNCQNQPEVHAITQALRTVARIAAPALIFKAEAIVGPADLAPYLGWASTLGRSATWRTRTP